MSTQLSTKRKDISALLQGPEFQSAVARVLPSHLKPDRFIRIAITALTRTPKLLECSQETFFKCLLDLSALGLEPDGRRAHLIPYGRDCTLVIDYKGLAELAMRSGVVSKLHADILCENDIFTYDRGEIVEHKIDFKKPRGAMYAAYALCRFKDGTEAVQVMSKEEIDGIRKRSRAGNNGPWVTDYNEMSKKTAFRRLSKWLPLSAEFRDAVEKDADELDDLSKIKIANVVSPPTQPSVAFQLPDESEEQHSQQNEAGGGQPSTGTTQSGPDAARAGKRVASGETAPANESDCDGSAEPAPDAEGAPVGTEEIPTEPAALVKFVRKQVADRDLEESSAVAFLRSKKRCGASCRTLGDVAASGLMWLAENIDVVKDEISNQ